MNTGAKAALFERRFREAVAAGKPPDRLRRHSTDEVERFYADVVPGPDGHSYWTGPQVFRRNDRRVRRPVRWVWEHKHGPLLHQEPVITICGEKNCLTPEHLTLGEWGAARRRYTHESVIGALQAVALRFGRTPTIREWRAGRHRPGSVAISSRFGTWEQALKAAGLKPNPRAGNRNGMSPELMISCLHALARHLGHPPTRGEFQRHTLWLREQGYPTSPTTIKAHLGKPWDEALRRAGLKPR